MLQAVPFLSPLWMLMRLLLPLLLAALPLHSWAGQDTSVPAPLPLLLQLPAATIADAGIAAPALPASAAALTSADAEAALLADAGQPAAPESPADPVQADAGEPAPTGADLAEQLLPSRALTVAEHAGRVGAPSYTGAPLPDPQLRRLPRPPRA